MAPKPAHCAWGEAAPNRAEQGHASGTLGLGWSHCWLTFILSLTRAPKSLSTRLPSSLLSPICMYSQRCPVPGTESGLTHVKFHTVRDCPAQTCLRISAVLHQPHFRKSSRLFMAVLLPLGTMRGHGWQGTVAVAQQAGLERGCCSRGQWWHTTAGLSRHKHPIHLTGMAVTRGGCSRGVKGVIQLCILFPIIVEDPRNLGRVSVSRLTARLHPLHRIVIHLLHLGVKSPKLTELG